MLLTFLDEAGTSQHEPVAVVAGVVASGDQIVAVEEYIRAMIEEYIPPADRPGFAFHATELWSGNRYYKDRERWPVATRSEILTRLADIPNRFRLPIVHGTFDKLSHHEIIASQPLYIRLFVHHACAFANAIQCTERFFRKIRPDRYTVIIAEDQPDIRRGIKLCQAWLQGRPTAWDDLTDFFDEFEELPLKHIRDTVHFAAKQESPMLQVADVCAFFLRGSLTRKPASVPFFTLLSRTLLSPQLN